MMIISLFSVGEGLVRQPRAHLGQVSRAIVLEVVHHDTHDVGGEGWCLQVPRDHHDQTLVLNRNFIISKKTNVVSNRFRRITNTFGSLQ